MCTTKFNIKKYPMLKTLMVLILASTMACISDTSDEKKKASEDVEIKPEVVFSIVDSEPLQFFIESRGVVEPIQKTVISPRTSGYVEEHQLIPGQRVNKGQVILQLDQEEAKLAVKEAYNNYLKFKSEYEVTARSQRSFEGEVNEELTKINTGFANAEVSYEKAKLNLKYTTITAPFDGTISTQEVISNGAFLGAGKELGTLTNTKKVRIRFDVLESEIAQLETGMKVDLTAPSGAEYQGSIVGISPEIDIESKTGQAIVEVNNADGALKTGMTMEGRMYVRSVEGKVRIPRSSLLERDGRTLIFRLKGDEAEWVYVEPVAMNTEYVIINHEDIEAGDTLAIDKHFSISHQQKIVPLMYN